MTTITTRAGKGSPLTNTEVDTNFSNLNTAKLELGQAQSSGTANGVLYLNASKQVASNGNFAIDSSGNLTQALGSSVATGGNLTVRSPDGVEGGQITLNNKANNAAAYNFDVDASDHGRLFTTQNNTNLSIGQIVGTGGIVTLHTSAAERIRIDSAGNIGIGATPSAGQGLVVNKSLTGAVGAYQITSRGEIQSDVTAVGNYFRSVGATQAAAFTLGEMRHYAAEQSTIGAGSTVTSQFGYYAANSLTGATNNFGFLSDIPSGTGRYNFYAAGTAANYFAGNTGIGAAANSNFRLTVSGVAYADMHTTTIAGVIGNNLYYGSGSWRYTGDGHGYGWAQTGTNGSDLILNYAVENTGGLGAAASTATRLRIDSGGNLGVGIDNPGVYGKLVVQGGAAGTASSSVALITPGSAQGERADIALYSTFQGTADNGPRRTADIIAGFNAGAWGAEYLAFNVGGSSDSKNLTTERMRIDAAGRVGIGGAVGVSHSFRVIRNVTGNAFSIGILSDGQVQSDATSRADYFLSAANVAAGTYPVVNGYQAQQGTLTGTVTSQRGFSADASLVGATNNYGFLSDIPSGTGRYNFYAAGTAANYFAGNVGIGTSSTNGKLDVVGDLWVYKGDATRGRIYLGNTNRNWSITTNGTDFAPNGGLVFADETGGAVRMTIDASGNLGIGTSSPSSYGKFTVYGDGVTSAIAGAGTTGAPVETQIAVSSYVGASYKAGLYSQNSFANNLANWLTFKTTNSTGTTSTVAVLDASSNLLLTGGGGLGYGTGSGGTVTQATSKATMVTLNKPTGQITMNNAALAAGATVGFIFNNSLLGSKDILIIHGGDGTFSAGSYVMRVGNTGAGSCSIYVQNISAGSLSEAVTINFAIIKGATA